MKVGPTVRICLSLSLAVAVVSAGAGAAAVPAGAAPFLAVGGGVELIHFFHENADITSPWRQGQRITEAGRMVVGLSRVLWVRGQAVSRTESAVDPRWVPGEGEIRSVRSGAAEGLVESAIDRALKAFNLVLQAGGFGIVALDLADAPHIALQRIPFTTWMRVQRAVER